MVFWKKAEAEAEAAEAVLNEILRFLSQQKSNICLEIQAQNKTEK